MSVRICMHISKHVYVLICIYVYMLTCIHVYMYIRMSVYLRDTCVFVYECIHTCIIFVLKQEKKCMCMYVYVSIGVHLRSNA